MSHVRSGTTNEIIKEAIVPVNDAYIPLDGKLVLETSDYIVALLVVSVLVYVLNLLSASAILT